MTKNFEKEFTKKFSEKFNNEANKTFNEEFNKKFNKGFNNGMNYGFGKDVNKDLNKEINRRVNEEINNKLNYDFNEERNYNFNEELNEPFNKEFSKEFSKAFNKEFNKRFKEVIDKNISNPDNLENIFNSTIEKSKRKILLKKALKTSKIIISTILILIISLNLFPSFSAFASDLPIVGKIAQIMTFDKGIKNAVENELYQKIGYSETKNGITLKVPSIAGDYRSLNLEYILEGIEKNDVKIDILDKERNEIPVASILSRSSADGSEDLNSYFEFMFENFVKEFIFVFKIYESQESSVSLAEFEVNVTLHDKFTKDVEKIELDKNIIETDVGNILIKDINSTKTRTYIEMSFESEEFEFMSFEGLALIDEKGNNHISRSGLGENILSIEGDLSKAKELTLKADGIYYLNKKNKMIKVNLKNKEIGENVYNIGVVSNEEIQKMGLYKNLEENMIVFEAKETRGLYFTPNDNIKWIRTNMIQTESKEEHGLEEYIRGAQVYVLYEILTNEEEIELEIDSIYSNISKPIEAKIK